MYIFKKSDGVLVPAPEGFNPDAPDFAELEDVDEVLFISKIYVKQLRLVVKPKEERDAIRAAMSEEDPQRAASGADLQEAVKKAVRSKNGR